MLRLELVTPSGVVADTQVDEVRLPGTSGELGVLPGHRPLLAALRSGVLRWRCGAQEIRMAIGPGFAKVGALDSVLVVTERTLRPEQVERERAGRDRDEAQAALQQWAAPLSGADDLPDPQHAALLDALRWAEAQLELTTASTAPR